VENDATSLHEKAERFQLQGRIQELPKEGRSLQSHSSPLLLFISPLTPLPSPLEIALFKPARESGGALSAPPVGSRADRRPKPNLAHFKVARKPLVAIIIILNILSTVF